MTRRQSSQSKKSFNPVEWPIERRRLIVWLGVALIMLILLVFWLASLRLSLMKEPNKSTQPLLDISQIRQDLNSGLEEIKQSSELLKRIETTTSATSPEIELLKEQNKIQLEKLRQKLEQLPNQSTAK